MAWSKVNLEPHSVTMYDDYQTIISQPGAERRCQWHCYLGARAVQSFAEAKKHPHLKVMYGFSCHFDQSYRDAHAKMDQGLIGRPAIIHSQTCDKHDLPGFFNISVHGIRAVQLDLTQYNDYDSAVGIVEFWGGRIAHYYHSRMMDHGQEGTTEIIGTEGKSTINGNPQSNLVNYYHARDITRELPAHYYGRFEMAFVQETNDFAEAYLDDKPLALKLTNAVRAVEICAAPQEALVSGKQIHFVTLTR
ncbi:hypothetical protein QQZ08_006867 [Neonectria magnoliae]|uniref:Gfo/Idh/MocA-like oxidoreductase C-terminal domain-containing protein n=1 Tax=Neonectria magnoliae TaxID=2732573 RepID=A0ABR1I0A3_9HYPO